VRQKAVIFPFSSPRLSFLASLIPINNGAATIVSTVIPRRMMQVCRLGVYHVSSKENALPARNSDTIDEFKRQAEVALGLRRHGIVYLQWVYAGGMQSR